MRFCILLRCLREYLTVYFSWQRYYIVAINKKVYTLLFVGRINFYETYFIWGPLIWSYLFVKLQLGFFIPKIFSRNRYPCNARCMAINVIRSHQHLKSKMQPMNKKLFS